VLGVTFYNDNDSVADFMTFSDYAEFLDWANSTDACDLLPNFEEGKYGPSAPPPFPQHDPPSREAEDFYYPVIFLGEGVESEEGLAAAEAALDAAGLALGEATLVGGTAYVFYEAGTHLGEQIADPLATGIALVYVKATTVWAWARTHRTNRAPSNREKHENGVARRGGDYGGEKGDTNRRPPRKRPRGWKGPWPPR
jgi:hypothetical protein